MSTKIKAIVIDDERLARDIIKKYLSENHEIDVIAEGSNGFEGIKKINELKPDIVFLDVQMPKINGFEMLELIDEPPVIIFSTAYDQYALKAFQVNAADYLLKPYSKERFNEALKKAAASIDDKRKKQSLLKNLIEHRENSTEYLDRVLVKAGPKISIIPAETIKWIEAKDDYVMIHSAGGKFLKQKTMKFFEERLNPKDFIRIHRSFIAAVKEIKKIELVEKESYQVILQNDERLPVSKSGYDKLKGRLTF
ncbi:MAG TPA: LytTR family transcriptional regulator DNA-binding domain-containing protein [Ignavibacteriaceae bacterium]|nr:LytTR family transcriptional regulator DNA-binding domain-containing protein [Ignavibacteriaceae bacterium]